MKIINKFTRKYEGRCHEIDCSPAGKIINTVVKRNSFIKSILERANFTLLDNDLQWPFFNIRQWRRNISETNNIQVFCGERRPT